MPKFRTRSLRRTVALVGAGLVVLGLGGIALDVFSMDQFDLVQYYEYFLLAILAGILFLIVGLIGWAKQLDRGRRVSIGAIVLIASVSICFFGYLMGGTNVHGPFYLFLLPMIPVGLVGLIILLMGAASRRR